MKIHNKRVVGFWLGMLWLGFTLLSCSGSDNPAVQRALRARRSRGPIIIGAAAPWSEKNNLLAEGIKLAVTEINNKGGVLNRQLKLVFADDKASVTTGQLVAQQFADNPDIIAVIGHSYGYISEPVSILYEYYGLLMLSPLSSTPKLTKRGFKHIFRNIPDDFAYGIDLAHLCTRHGKKRVIICQIKNEFGTGLANAFENECLTNNIKIVDRFAYNSASDMTEIKKRLSFWQENYKFDTIFLAAEMPAAAEIVRCARSLGIDTLILGSNRMYNHNFLQMAGNAAEGVIIPSIFHPEIDLPSTIDFVDSFKARYGQIPDYAAEQGYDAVNILAQAIEAAKTTEPVKIAASMHSSSKWQGVTGPYSFDSNGNVKSRNIFFTEVKNGQFSLLPE